MPLAFTSEAPAVDTTYTPYYMTAMKDSTQAIVANTWTILDNWTKIAEYGSFTVPDTGGGGNNYFTGPTDAKTYLVMVTLTRSITTNDWEVALSNSSNPTNIVTIHYGRSSAGALTDKINVCGGMICSDISKIYVHVRSTDACNIPSSTSIPLRCQISISQIY